MTAQDLAQYGESFRANEVNGKTLITLTDKDLKEDLGVSVLGHRKQILREIEMYKVLLSTTEYPLSTTTPGSCRTSTGCVASRRRHASTTC